MHKSSINKRVIQPQIKYIGTLNLDLHTITLPTNSGSITLDIWDPSSSPPQDHRSGVYNSKQKKSPWWDERPVLMIDFFEEGRDARTGRAGCGRRSREFEGGFKSPLLRVSQEDLDESGFKLDKPFVSLVRRLTAGSKEFKIGGYADRPLDRQLKSKEVERDGDVKKSDRAQITTAKRDISNATASMRLRMPGSWPDDEGGC